MEPGHWILQANPTHYDIDAALRHLNSIWWRSPQYTGEIQVGDVVVLWRSGKESGIVGIGRVLAPPQAHGMAPEERPFVLHDDEAPDSTTRVQISIRATPYITKERVKSIPELSDHAIVRAPMGTVFPLSTSEWSALAPHVGTPPALDEQVLREALPPAFSLEQRAKGVMPMPGGYDGYLASTRRICAIIDELRPTSAELSARISDEFGVGVKGARNRESFLRKVGIIRVDGGLVHVTEWTRRWLESSDDDVLVALLHSRCRFIGEMLFETRTPRSVDDLLAIVSVRYGLKWDTNTQINNRRGWLQSAGHLTVDGDGMISVTDAGRALLARLDLQRPDEGTGASVPKPLPSPAAPTESPATPAATQVPAPEALALEIESSSTDSGDPNRFERAVRDAFAFLGFEAEWLGGSGQTDVLLDAPLGKESSFSVTVDAKTTAKGSLGDQQVDWQTLDDHRELHKADYCALVAPNPSTGRLAERAQNHHVAVLSARQLAGLVRQHARVPLVLSEYRALFTTGGMVDTTDLDEIADDGDRLVRLAAALCQTLNDDCMTFGPLRARDLWMTLARSEIGEGSSEEEIQTLLDALGSPLVRAIDGSATDGYVLATSPKVTQMRLRLLGEIVADDGQ